MGGCGTGIKQHLPRGTQDDLQMRKQMQIVLGYGCIDGRMRNWNKYR